MSTTMNHRKLAAAALAVAALAGCSSNSSSSTPSSSSTVPAGTGSTSASPGTTASSPLASTVSTPVPAPSSGSIKQTVAPRPVASATPVAVGKTSEVVLGVKVTITQVKAITASSTVPGDVAGPAVQFTVTVENSSSRAVPAANATVNVTGSDKKPAVMLLGPPTKAFSGEVAAGKSSSATYGFRVAKGARKPITIQVSVDPSLPVASFTGDVA